MINPTNKMAAGLLTLTAALLLGACAGSGGMRVTQGNEQVGSAPTGTVIATAKASIVHVDLSERIATLRRGRAFPAGIFLETRNREDKRTALLKVLPRQGTELRTAYILEGEPRISDAVAEVGDAESRRLVERYPEAATQ